MKEDSQKNHSDHGNDESMKTKGGKETNEGDGRGESMLPKPSPAAHQEGVNTLPSTASPWHPATNPSAPLTVGLLMDNRTSWPGFPTPTLPLTHAEPICPRSGGKEAALPTLEGGEWGELPGSIERKPSDLGMSISISQRCSAPSGEVLWLSQLSLAVRLRGGPSKAKKKR